MKLLIEKYTTGILEIPKVLIYIKSCTLNGWANLEIKYTAAMNSVGCCHLTFTHRIRKPFLIQIHGAFALAGSFILDFLVSVAKLTWQQLNGLKQVYRVAESHILFMIAAKGIFYQATRYFHK